MYIYIYRDRDRVRVCRVVAVAPRAPVAGDVVIHPHWVKTDHIRRMSESTRDVGTPVAALGVYVSALHDRRP